MSNDGVRLLARWDLCRTVGRDVTIVRPASVGKRSRRVGDSSDDGRIPPRSEHQPRGTARLSRCFSVSTGRCVLETKRLGRCVVHPRCESWDIPTTR